MSLRLDFFRSPSIITNIQRLVETHEDRKDRIFQKFLSLSHDLENPSLRERLITVIESKAIKVVTGILLSTEATPMENMILSSDEITHMKMLIARIVGCDIDRVTFNITNPHILEIVLKIHLLHEDRRAIFDRLLGRLMTTAGAFEKVDIRLEASPVPIPQEAISIAMLFATHQVSAEALASDWFFTNLHNLSKSYDVLEKIFKQATEGCRISQAPIHFLRATAAPEIVVSYRDLLIAVAFLVQPIINNGLINDELVDWLFEAAEKRIPSERIVEPIAAIIRDTRSRVGHDVRKKNIEFRKQMKNLFSALGIIPQDKSSSCVVIREEENRVFLYKDRVPTRKIVITWLKNAAEFRDAHDIPAEVIELLDRSVSFGVDIFKPFIDGIQGLAIEGELSEATCEWLRKELVARESASSIPIGSEAFQLFIANPLHKQLIAEIMPAIIPNSVLQVSEMFDIPLCEILEKDGTKVFREIVYLIKDIKDIDRVQETIFFRRLANALITSDRDQEEFELFIKIFLKAAVYDPDDLNRLDVAVYEHNDELLDRIEKLLDEEDISKKDESALEDVKKHLLNVRYSSFSEALYKFMSLEAGQRRAIIRIVAEDHGLDFIQYQIELSNMPADEMVKAKRFYSDEAISTLLATLETRERSTSSVSLPPIEETSEHSASGSGAAGGGGRQG